MDHLRSLFRCAYEIDSLGLRPQIQLVKALASGEIIKYDIDAAMHRPSETIAADDGSNLLAVPVVMALDPLTVELDVSGAPTDFFGEYTETLRAMKTGLTVAKRAGRSNALRVMAGIVANRGTELTPREAAIITRRLRPLIDHSYVRELMNDSKYEATLDTAACLKFVSGENRVIRGLENAIYEHWNNAGREERVSYHAKKLGMMAVIVDVSVQKAQTLGVDPNTFTRNDPAHSAYWREIYNEDVPSPNALVSASRDAMVSAMKKYRR